MKRERFQNGIVWLDRRVRIWYFRWFENSKRKSKRIGSLAEYPTKAKAEKAAAPYRSKLVAVSTPKKSGTTFEAIALRYMAEKMPKRKTTSGGYRNYLLKYAIPQWGDTELLDIEPMAVWRWLMGIEGRAPKTKSHIRSVMRLVFEYAMLAGTFPIQRNPMDLVEVKGASKRVKKVRVLTYEEWARFIAQLTAEPYRTMVIVCICLGLRREEVWGLKWSDFDFVAESVHIQRGIIGGEVGDVKNDTSDAILPIDEELRRLLLSWRQRSQFNKPDDWVWASPWTAGEKPYYLNAVQRDYIIPAAIKAGLGQIGWHTLRHTYRAWLNASGAPLGVQKDLMRHANLSTTANVYGAGVLPAMREANSKVVKLVIQ